VQRLGVWTAQTLWLLALMVNRIYKGTAGKERLVKIWSYLPEAYRLVRQSQETAATEQWIMSAKLCDPS
jgi:hypothetical protein